jgi:hypothetical protein
VTAAQPAHAVVAAALAATGAAVRQPGAAAAVQIAAAAAAAARGAGVIALSAAVKRRASKLMVIDGHLRQAGGAPHRRTATARTLAHAAEGMPLAARGQLRRAELARRLPGAAADRTGITNATQVHAWTPKSSHARSSAP